MSQRKRLILIFSIFYIAGCKNQTANNNTIQKQDSIVMDDTSLIKSKDSSVLNLFVRKYADSLDGISKGGTIPVFLQDAQFDYHNTGVFSPFHSPISLRKMIINNVTECNSLKTIINSENKTYKKKPGKSEGIDVEYSNLSFVDLALKRYQELNCK